MEHKSLNFRPNDLFLIAGPCAIESENQLRQILTHESRPTLIRRTRAARIDMPCLFFAFFFSAAAGLAKLFRPGALPLRLLAQLRLQLRCA